MSMKMMALMAGMGVVGYMYLKKHPEAIDMMKEMGRDATKKVNKMMEEE